MPRAALWLDLEPLLLASGSATRRTLLEAAGIPVEVEPARIDERAIEAELQAAGAAPDAVALGLARAKASAVSRMRPGRLVLGADQTLAFEGDAFHKPADRAAAAAQLARLGGREHALHAAAALYCDDRLVFEAVSTARLRMRPLSPAMIARYLDAAGDIVTTTVGAYQLESVGVHLFDTLAGDHFTILGLPLLPLLEGLRRSGRVVS